MYETEYRSKLTTPEAAVRLVARRGTLSMGMAVSEPPALLQALEGRVAAGEIENLRVYYSHSAPAAMMTILKYEHMNVIKPHPFFPTVIERELARRGAEDRRQVVFYMPGNFSAMPRVLADIGIDAFMVMVSPMDKGGFFSCGTNGDYTIPTARNAKRLIVEVNPRMPRVFGDSSVHISDVDAIVEHESALQELPTRPVTDLDRTIGKYIVELVPDRATLQIGVGGVPNAVCGALTNHKDLGIHTELMTSPVAALIQSGAVTNKYKRINQYKNVYTLAAGDRSLYEFLHDNSGMEVYPVDYVNDPWVIGRNDRVVSINAFLQVGLDGEVNSETLNGKQYSAPGGQLDFVRGAQLSEEGKSILAAYSTAAGGTVSRIVARIDGPATDPRADTEYVVTEYGVANLRGKSSPERAEALIAIAHPKFRDELGQRARESGYL
jgi:itaconate CoA-transferase